ncbi:glycosyltransferase family 9 protein [Ktedonosporobacter rubrisoli]|uniref:Glycosyltransferase family 9 protein n=1 Tax=Ktedonosporobacter rubrisoli TaxID=2509675 RepID=A0A4P6JZ37_KTERU|nr:glycosyltransferase family 9 protein [Ktedonosporobacter rubrisoli]QBD80984.1 glycosyltransferase family 9 protein [Ktedonosporobacter rubrisoli]
MENTRILVIRPGAIGDVLLSFPVIAALKAQYAHPYVTLVSPEPMLELARATGIAEGTSHYGSPQWSELFLTPERIAARGGSLLREQLRDLELAICWFRDPDGLVEQNLRAAGARRVIVAPGRPVAEAHIHIVDYLARTVGVKVDLAQARLQLAPELTQVGAAPPVPWIAIQPGSGGAAKCWPLTSYAELITELWQRNIPILLLGGPADQERLAYLQARLRPARSELLTILEDAPLLTVARYLLRCRGYLGNDSGITHLAALLGIPTIAIFGPSDPAIWQPAGPHVSILQEPELANLHIAKVMYTIETFFKC